MKCQSDHEPGAPFCRPYLEAEELLESCLADLDRRVVETERGGRRPGAVGSSQCLDQFCSALLDGYAERDDVGMTLCAGNGELRE